MKQEKGIPFSMKMDDQIENPGIRAMKRAGRIAEEYGVSDMSPDEINAEIAEARKQQAVSGNMMLLSEKPVE